MKQKNASKFYDLAAEDQLLAAAIKIRKVALSPGFGPQLFTEERTELCSAIISLTRSDESITEKHLELKGCGEAAMLAFGLIKEIESYPDTGEAGLITELLTDLALRRHVCESLRELHGNASTLKAEELINEVNGLATSSQRILDGNNAKGMLDGSDLNELLDDIKRRIESPDQLSGMSTGMGNNFDRAIDGLGNGRLILIGGRPHLGKTSLGIAFASGIMEADKSVAYFSAEMTKLNLQQAMLDFHSGVQIRAGVTPTKHDLIKMKEAAMRISKFKFHIDDSDRVTIDAICAKSRVLHRTKGLHAIVVDYAQIIGFSPALDMRLGIAEISGRLKALAKELNIPVILLSQINRALPRLDPKTGGNIYPKPTLANLKESSSLESDADVVILIDRNLEAEEPGEMEVEADLILAKNRCTGILCTVPARFDKKRRKFMVLPFFSPY